MVTDWSLRQRRLRFVPRNLIDPFIGHRSSERRIPRKRRKRKRRIPGELTPTTEESTFQRSIGLLKPAPQPTLGGRESLKLLQSQDREMGRTSRRHRTCRHRKNENRLRRSRCLRRRSRMPTARRAHREVQNASYEETQPRALAISTARSSIRSDGTSANPSTGRCARNITRSASHSCSPARRDHLRTRWTLPSDFFRAELRRESSVRCALRRRLRQHGQRMAVFWMWQQRDGISVFGTMVLFSRIAVDVSQWNACAGARHDDNRRSPGRRNGGPTRPGHGTVILDGNDAILKDVTAGGRFTIGTWLDDCQDRSLILRGWFAGDETHRFSTDQTVTTVIARPFFNVSDDQAAEHDTQLVAFPARSDGSISVRGDSSVYGADVSVRQEWWNSLGLNIDLLYGYQFMRMDESLGISSFSTSLDDDFAPVGSTLASTISSTQRTNFTADNSASRRCTERVVGRYDRWQKSASGRCDVKRPWRARPSPRSTGTPPPMTKGYWSVIPTAAESRITHSAGCPSWTSRSAGIVIRDSIRRSDIMSSP